MFIRTRVYGLPFFSTTPANIRARIQPRRRRRRHWTISYNPCFFSIKSHTLSSPSSRADVKPPPPPRRNKSIHARKHVRIYPYFPFTGRLRSRSRTGPYPYSRRANELYAISMFVLRLTCECVTSKHPLDCTQLVCIRLIVVRCIECRGFYFRVRVSMRSHRVLCLNNFDLRSYGRN